MPPAMLMDPQAAVASLETGKTRAVIDACSSLDRHLKANQDNLRGFFSDYYLRICRRIFGAGCPSLLGEVSQYRRECDALLKFLDPAGMLFRAMMDADKAHLNQYHLPVHMLSAHAQSMLLTAEGTQVVSQWPHYHTSLETNAAVPVSATTMPSPILSHLIAPLTSTFFIMMASAAVQGTPITAASAPPSAQSLQNLQTPHDWHVLDSPLLRQGMERLSHRSSPSSRIHNSPYIVLIRSFLRSLLPQGAQNDHTARSSTHSAPPIGAQFLTAVLDMWLTDLDMPTPSNSQKAIATGRRGSPKTAAAGRLNHSPSTLRAAAIYTVPTTLRVTAIKELVSHIYLCPPPRSRAASTVPLSHSRSGAARPVATPAQAAGSWLPRESVSMSSSVANLPWLPPISGPNFKHTLAHQLGASAEPAVQNVAAHVYRFLHRAFVHWPVGQSAEQLDAVVDLWLAVAFPWTGVDRAKYTPAWQGHVLAHLPFYFCLFPMYLDLVIHTASVAAQQAAKHLRRVVRDAGQRHSAQQSSVSAGMELHRPEFLQAFYRETELCKLLREVEVAHACLHAGRAIPDSAQVDLDLTLLATLTTQQFGLLERAATASRDGRKQAEDAVDFQIFAVDVPPPPGAHQARAHRAPEKAAEVLQLLQGNVPADVYRTLRDCLSFMDWERFQSGFSRHEHHLQYTPQARGLDWGGPGHVTPATVPYKGEFLLRPAGRNEVSVLVEPLARASIKLNEWLGFYSDENLDLLHPVFRKVVVRLKRRGHYVDLRRLFEHQSLVFLSLTCTTLFYVMSQVMSQPMAVFAVCLFQAGLLGYCTM